MEYLNMFMKEVMRFDGVAKANFKSNVTKEFEIEGIKILKNTEIIYDIDGFHYKNDEWIEPEKFIPERFDPESKYFKRPDSG